MMSTPGFFLILSFFPVFEHYSFFETLLVFFYSVLGDIYNPGFHDEGGASPTLAKHLDVGIFPTLSHGPFKSSAIAARCHSSAEIGPSPLDTHRLSPTDPRDQWYNEGGGRTGFFLFPQPPGHTPHADSHRGPRSLVQGGGAGGMEQLGALRAKHTGCHTFSYLSPKIRIQISSCKRPSDHHGAKYYGSRSFPF